MAIAEVIKFEGDPNQLVWKHPAEDFNTTSQLIVDETHEALLVLNGNAADLFGPGRHTLTTNNIPILRKLQEIPTGGATPFPCKVFFINKVHQMDMLWGTQGAIPLEDPLYDIFMHVMLHGSISVSVDDSRKFLLKLVGFRDRFDANTLVSKFRGIISSQVKDAISKIMIRGQLSYFMISSELLEISGVVKERLDEVFDEYGVHIEFFNIEAIEVPDKDYAEISQAKKLRSSRLIQGYTWQEERQMMIAEKFAGNQGAMGTIGGMMGGVAGGIAMGSTIAEVAKNALSADRIPTQAPPKNVAGAAPVMGANAPGAAAGQTVDVSALLRQGAGAAPARPEVREEKISPEQMPERQQMEGYGREGKFCPECGSPVAAGAKFCSECGHKMESNVCPGCGSPITPGAKFCSECGTRLI